MNTVKLYTPKDSTWTDASGNPVPVKYVSPTDKKKETLAAKLHKAALAIEASLSAFHVVMYAACQEVAQMVREEFELKEKKQAKPNKGNITWYNFDKSLKIEADVQDIVKWDEAMMNEALILLKEYLNKSIGEDQHLISGLVNEAFANSKGGIDTRKIFTLLKYENKVKNDKFTKACKLMRDAQGIDKTKLYMRIWEKQDNGSYRNINLNFSSI